MFMQMPLPAPHGSASHSFTSEKDARIGETSKGSREPAPPPGYPHAPLTHAVVVLRMRPVARVAMAGVAGGALDALSVATDVLVQSALVCFCGPGLGDEVGAGQGALTFCHIPPFLMIWIPDHGVTSGPCMPTLQF